MGPLSIEEVLAEEADKLHWTTRPDLVVTLKKLQTVQQRETDRSDKDADQRSGRDEDPQWVKDRKTFYCELTKIGRAALCCSGGGIRSATFCLGVIQALAKHKVGGQFTNSDLHVTKPAEMIDNANQSLLSRFHYLSTVSGGGYIGSWLSAWRTKNSFPTIWRNLATRPDGPDVEPAEISWLRSYSSYLTPKTGIFSADTWAAAAIYLRNLLLNWLIIIPAVAAVLLLLKLSLTVSVLVARIDYAWWPALLAALIGIACLIVALAFTTGHRPTRRLRPNADRCLDPRNVDQGAFLRGNLVWSFLSAMLLTSALASLAGVRLACGAETGVCSVTTFHAIAVGAVAGPPIFAAGWLIGCPQNLRCKDFWLWTASGVIYGGFVGLGAHLYAAMMPYEHIASANNGIDMILVPVVLGVPWIMVAQLFAEMVFVGLVSYEIGGDSDREWLGRAAGWISAVAVLWIAVTGVAIAGGYLLIKYAGPWITSSITSAGGISGLITAWLGKSAKTPAQPKNGEQSPTDKAYEIGLAVAGPLFAAILIVGISIALDILLLDDSLLARLAVRMPDYLDISFWLLLGFAIAGGVAWIASYSVNINRFSAHAIYRNRLVRAYLGASQQKRCPDLFTGLDSNDNLPAHKLWPPKPTLQGTNTYNLFHVVNITLNVVKTARLAWQQRKAEPFTVSPLHSGAAYKGFRTSEEYALGNDPSCIGISLGTAMAISGAAASPNMGYHSSPSITLLLALFNVRLGWWLGNPGKEGEETYKEEGPSTAILPLVEETFGLTTDDKPWVYLSDGGHFENLGLYEMVRRRCRLVVAIDAGCDPNFQFEDLGNAVRKIFIDLGVRITFPTIDQLKNRPTAEELANLTKPHLFKPANLKSEAKKKAGGKDQSKSDEKLWSPIPYHAVGKIHYEDADGADCKNGYVIYLKPAYHGTSQTEGAAVRSYAEANKAFPHEPTADQWFTESQFESYRALGLDVANSVFDQDLELESGLTLSQLLADLAPTSPS